MTSFATKKKIELDNRIAEAEMRKFINKAWDRFNFGKNGNTISINNKKKKKKPKENIQIEIEKLFFFL